ncbi:tetratricopeptide repeat protein [Desulfosediminicola ganghwensis]|uniref:tetratricopeptide repeat protein n=1 Tax=Desulfosediminicola ganghwensis TaxID=2569540 RepID=UPI0010AB7EA1|nr:tetratricopeptide repeat protein [Desulfosediminicola ganghwensis]
MVSKKPDAFPLHIVFLPILAFLLILPSANLHSAIAPEREIIPIDAPDVPTWKKHWDRGRELARLGKYQDSAAYYKELVLLKPQIEEAKWEYCKILFRLDEYEKISPLVEGLIENNPYNIEYIKLAGKVALELGEYKKAVQYLGQAYSLTPEGEEGARLLQDFAEALEGRGKLEEAFVLYEQLRQRKNKDFSLLHDLARKSKALAKREKALDYYSLLADESKDNVAVLAEAADIFVEYGENQRAYPLWKSIVRLKPEALAYHQKLADYYLSSANGREALPHLLALIDNDKNFDPELLLITARIYAREGDRVDQSLRYFERYLKVFPQNSQAKRELEEVREKIADALLAIVENNGARLLWNDLDKITDDRMALFKIMANRLELEEKTTELIEVLEVIDENSLHNEDVKFKLSNLYAGRGDEQLAYEYLTTISGQLSASMEFCLAKAKLEENIGLDVEALESYLCALDWDKDNLSILKNTIEIAGDIGRLDTLKALGDALTSRPIVSDELEVYLAYAKGLRLNGQYSVAESLYSKILNAQWNEPDARNKITLSKARTFRDMGKLFDSQRVLREIIAEDLYNQDAIIQLIKSVAENDSLNDGWSLFWFYVSGIDEKNWREPSESDLVEVFLTYIYLLEREGSYNLAISDLTHYLEEFPPKAQDRDSPSSYRNCELKLCDLYLVIDKNAECRSILREYPENTLHDPDVWVSQQYLEGEGRFVPEELYTENGDLKEPNSGLRGLFSAAVKAVGNGENHAAVKITEFILQIEPESRRARIQLARALSNIGRLNDAAEEFRDLNERGGDSGVFMTEYLLLEFRRGNYDSILGELAEKDFETLPVEQKLLLARTLWALGELKSSLVTYRELLTPNVSSQFKQRLAEKDLHLDWEEGGEAMFWSLFTHEGPGQLDKLNKLRAEDGFLSITGTPLGEIVAELYDSYRWEKLIKNEYQIREAVEDKNYVIAERQNRARLKEEQSVEGLKDLAKVYERLGNYTEEAEVYAYLQARGETLPELQELMERNRLARAPTLSGEAMYSERSGRDGAVDIEKYYYGANFKYLAGLRKEFQFEYGELKYQPESGGSSIDGREFGGKARFELSKNTSLRLEGGFHLLESDPDSMGIYAIKFDHEFDPVLKGYLQFRKDVVDDTVEALNQGIYRSSLIGGLVIDGASGVSIGSEFQHKWFKGGNDQDGMQFWSSYTFFSDYTSLSVKYSYDLLKSSESNFIVSDTDTADGSFDTGSDVDNFNDLPYWSPGSYWQHELSFSFRHLLKDFDTFQNTPSFYLLDFAIGYEADGNVRYTGAFDIFLEMNEHFLLKGEVLYSRSDNYNEKTAAMSLMYRW